MGLYMITTPNQFDIYCNNFTAADEITSSVLSTDTFSTNNVSVTSNTQPQFTISHDPLHQISISSSAAGNMVLGATGGEISSTDTMNLAAANFSGLVSLNNTTNSTSSETGALFIKGGVVIEGNVRCLSNLYTSIVSYENKEEILTEEHILSTSESTNISTGALICDGGAGFAKDVYVGDSLNVNGATNCADTVTVNKIGSAQLNLNYKDLTNNENTAMETTLFSDFRITPKNPLATMYVNHASLNVNSTSDTAITSIGGLSMTKGVSCGSLSVLGTTQSTDIASGSVVINGGMGIAKDVFVDGHVHLKNTEDCTSSITGAGLNCVMTSA